jgi:hypothetical protein
MRDQKAYNISVDLLVAAGQEETWLPVKGWDGMGDMQLARLVGSRV